MNQNFPPLTALAPQDQSRDARLAGFEAAVAEIHRQCQDAGIAPGRVQDRVRALVTQLAAALATIEQWTAPAPDDERDNAKALADRMQHLLDSSRHECDALCEELDVSRSNAEESPYSPCCDQDLETVSLQELIRHVALYLDEGQALTIHPGEHYSISAFGCEFVGRLHEANGLLDAAATLSRAAIPA